MSRQREAVAWLMRLFFTAVLLLAGVSAVAQAPARIPVKVVVVTMFEIGTIPATRPASFSTGLRASISRGASPCLPRITMR